MGGTVLWQRFEGAAIFMAAVTLFVCGDYNWSWWVVIPAFFAPDLSFAGYLLGPRIGAFSYNVVHIYAFGILLAVIGALLKWHFLNAAGVLWLAHSGFDRMLGYGLKFQDGLALTHLGRIGRRSPE